MCLFQVLEPGTTIGKWVMNLKDRIWWKTFIESLNLHFIWGKQNQNTKFSPLIIFKDF